MTVAERKNLAALLADRVRDKADRDDMVGMFRAASLLDQVNEEIAELEEAPAADEQPLTGRRIFVKD